jgi:tetratricopeptide (TPR) repeat protein
MNGRQTAALQQYELNYRQSPENIETNIYLGQIYTDQKKWDAALLHTLNLVRTQPSNFRFWQKAGALYLYNGDNDSALYFYNQAYHLNPKSGSIVVSLSDLLILANEKEPAEALVKQFLLQNSTDQEVIAKWMDINFSKGNYDTVIKWGIQLWRDSAILSTPYIHLAFSYLNQKNYEESISVCEWMINKKIASQAILYCEALALKALKNYTKSNQLLDECIQQTIQKQAQTYLEAKGDNYEEMKDYQQSLNYYDTAYYIFKNPIDLYFAGRIQDQFLHNKAKAANLYSRYRKLTWETNDETEKRILKYIESFLKPSAVKAAN